jgi:hypothetical protein
MRANARGVNPFRKRLVFQVKRILLVSIGLLALVSSIYWFTLAVQGFILGAPVVLAAGGILLVRLGMKMTYYEDDS